MIEKILAICIGVLIGYVIICLTRFIYRAYWEIKLKREIEKFKKNL